jgi:chaperonin GroES
MEWNYKPLGDRVVVEIVKRHDEKTAGGLYKPSGSETTMTGKVVAVGNGLFTQTGDKIPMSVKEGDTVLLDGTGFKHRNGKDTYHIYRESELLVNINRKIKNKKL